MILYTGRPEEKIHRQLYPWGQTFEGALMELFFSCCLCRDKIQENTIHYNVSPQNSLCLDIGAPIVTGPEPDLSLHEPVNRTPKSRGG